MSLVLLPATPHLAGCRVSFCHIVLVFFCIPLECAQGDTALLTVDTTALKIKIGTGTPTLGSGTTGALFVSDSVEIAGQIRIGDATNHQVRYNGNARNTKTIALVPEFAGIVLHPDGANNTGTLTSDIDTTAGAFRNYYNWTTTQATAQDYDLYVRIPVPRDFAAFNSSGNSNIVVCYYVWTDDTTSSVVTAQLYDTASASAGTFTATPTANSTWQQKCSTTQYNNGGSGTFTVNGDTYITVDMHFAAGTNKNTRISAFTIDYLSTF